MSTQRVAAIDCGTNSIRLLIAEADSDADAHRTAGAGFSEIDRRTEIVRLGQGVDATGELHPDALARTFAAVDEYARLIRDAGVEPDRIAFVATSATRDARNREDFDAGIKRRLGVRPQVISGQAEAALSFRGATSGTAGHPQDEQDGSAEPVLVMDIGGGSTELILGADSELIDSVSLDMGAVRLTERFWHSDPPSADDVVQARAFVDDLLDGTSLDLGSVGSWIGVAGTATTLAGVALELPAYDRSKVHGATVTRSTLESLFERLSALSAEQIREIPSMHPKRADVITAGTLIATTVAARVGTDTLTVSEADILDGIVLSQLDL